MDFIKGRAYEFEDQVLTDNDDVSGDDTDIDDFDEAELFDNIEVVSLEDYFRRYY